MTIIDVRNSEEYNSGHFAHAINIPLNEIPHRLNDIRALSVPIILCCASGNRSAQAVTYLKQQGISCANGGSWQQVATKLEQR